MAPMFTQSSSTNRPAGVRTRRSRRERGHAVVEFALGFSVLWMVFSGVYELGSAFYAYNVLKTSVASAAEFGSRLEYDISHPTAYVTMLQNMVVYGDIESESPPKLLGLTRENVHVSLNLDTNSIPRGVTVSIIGYPLDVLFKTFSLSGKPQATTVYMGRVVCSGC